VRQLSPRSPGNQHSTEKRAQERTVENRSVQRGGKGTASGSATDEAVVEETGQGANGASDNIDNDRSFAHSDE